MNYKENKFGVFLFATACCLIAAHVLKLIPFNISLIIGCAMTVYSIPSFYSAMTHGKRLQLVLSVSLFFTGLILILINRFEILNPLYIVFPSLVFIIGIIFLFLYVENNKESAFLITGIAATAVGIISIIFNKNLPLFYFADRVILVISNYWYVLLIGTGLYLLINKSRK